MRNKYLSRNDYFNILTVIDKIDKIKFQCATCTSLSQIIRDDCLFDLLRFSRNCTDWFFTRESEEEWLRFFLPILDEMKITVSFSIVVYTGSGNVWIDNLEKVVPQKKNIYTGSVCNRKGEYRISANSFRGNY